MLRPHPTPPPEYVSKLLLSISYSYASLLALMALLQLAFFGNFLLYIGGFFSAGPTSGTVFVAGMLVALELFALPFLLRRELSALARFSSAILGLIVPLAWALVTFGTNAKASYGFINVGFLLLGLISFWALNGQEALRLRGK